tara:strand:- start:210 stop:485 length:276 start_codon:yes stop_codon:yes gene_type:complete
MKDFLTFRVLIFGPKVVQFIFWPTAIITFAIGIGDLILKEQWDDRLLGAALAILGPLFARLICEIYVVFFRLNEAIKVEREEKRTEELPLD